MAVHDEHEIEETPTNRRYSRDVKAHFYAVTTYGFVGIMDIYMLNLFSAIWLERWLARESTDTVFPCSLFCSLSMNTNSQDKAWISLSCCHCGTLEHVQSPKKRVFHNSNPSFSAQSCGNLETLSRVRNPRFIGGFFCLCKHPAPFEAFCK